MQFEEDNTEIKERFSQEFIKQLDNKPKFELEDSQEASIFTNKFFIGGVIAAFAVLLLIFVTSIFFARKNQTLHSFSDLYFSVKKSKTASDKYKNMINDNAVRSSNSNFYITLSAIEVTLDNQKNTFSQEKKQKVDKIIAKGDDTVNDVLNQLEAAYLNESLDRVYLNQMVILIDEMRWDMAKIIKNSRTSDFTKQLRTHYDSLGKIKESIKKTRLDE